MVRVDDKTISLGTLISILALAGVGITAWVDVKSDIAVNAKATSTNEKHDTQIIKRLERMETKIDRIAERGISTH